MEGWIKLYRSLKEWQWYSDINVSRLFIHLLLSASFVTTKWQDIVINRGQCIVGRESLSRETGLSEQQVRTALKKLQKSEEITTKATNKYTIITITNFDRYQGGEDIEQPTNQPTNNQQITNNQPTNNQQITTYKNVKNDNNEKNDKKSSSVKFTPPTLEEVRAYCKEINSIINAEDWMDYYTSNGFKVSRNPMKDWKATVRRWDREERKKKLSSASQKPQMTLDVNKYWNIKN